ncbi:MAG: anthranilate synthase component II [Sphingobacteriaceae bacterium]
MKILLVDNYDSFTYNLLHLIQKLGAQYEVSVRRNDQLSLEEVDEYDRILLSPGPGLPADAGLLLSIIKTYAGKKPILGICLGHQAIGEVFGAKLLNLSQVAHGLATPINKTDINSPLFKNLPETFLVGRYHSWVLSPQNFPEALQITATDEAGNIMALQHENHSIQGLQFHPESVLTPDGETMMKAWLEVL